MKAYARLTRHWAQTGAEMTTICQDEEALAQLEARYGIALPEAFRDYLRCACPRDGFCMDQATTWWPLERIKSLPQECGDIENPAVAANAGNYLFFADFAVWCFAWAINCGHDEHRGKVVVIGSSGDRFVADSFGAFVDRYIEDPRSVA